MAVIGSKVREILFGKADPVGKQIELRGRSYQVVGEFEDAGGEAAQRQIYVPSDRTSMAYQGLRPGRYLRFRNADVDGRPASKNWRLTGS